MAVIVEPQIPMKNGLSPPKINRSKNVKEIGAIAESNFRTQQQVMDDASSSRCDSSELDGHGAAAPKGGYHESKNPIARLRRPRCRERRGLSYRPLGQRDPGYLSARDDRANLTAGKSPTQRERIQEKAWAKTAHLFRHPTRGTKIKAWPAKAKPRFFD
jgi:hypothetical protein